MLFCFGRMLLLVPLGLFPNNLTPGWFEAGVSTSLAFSWIRVEAVGSWVSDKKRPGSSLAAGKIVKLQGHLLESWEREEKERERKFFLLNWQGKLLVSQLEVAVWGSGCKCCVERVFLWRVTCVPAFHAAIDKEEQQSQQFAEPLGEFAGNAG